MTSLDLSTMKIKKLDQLELSEFRSLIAIFNEVFENDKPIPENNYLSKLLSNPNFMVFVVMLNNEVVGGLTVYILQRYYSPQPSAFIYDVAISPNFQRRGLGKALIEHVSSFCKENGYYEAFVDAEFDDLDAVNFYKATPVSNVMSVVQFTYSFAYEL